MQILRHSPLALYLARVCAFRKFVCRLAAILLLFLVVTAPIVLRCTKLLSLISVSRLSKMILVLSLDAETKADSSRLGVMS